MARSQIKDNKPVFDFDSSFKETFNALIDVYSKALDRLNRISSGKEIKSEYGVCNCCYKLRYITPKDVSTYVSHLVKGFEEMLFNNSIQDIEMFTVASVKRFIENNGCVPFESSNTLDGANHYVNPKNQTLNDLAFMCKNDVCQVAVYSRGEMTKRIELMNDDVKKMNDIHFTANMKKIVASLPSIINNDSHCSLVYSPVNRLMFTKFIEEFLLFVCTLNTIAVLQLIGYGYPEVEYTTKPDGTSSNVVTECCMLKTNDFMIRNRIPFNCNMRDIVLQDITPNFKDTHDALHFIMKDRRSPISILVNRFASKEANTEVDSEIMGNLFMNFKHHHGPRETWHTKDGNAVTGCPRCDNGFRNKPAWLDTITFGNNYLDGNYRRDAVGNDNSNTIVNTLDAVYKIYGGCKLTSNEDIANNVVRVACLMRSLIRAYKEERPENYDMTKDILVLLGEILTRNMLKLYYNNTRVYCYDDNMPDAAAPGFLCMESYIMEAGEATNNTNTNNASTTTTTTTSGSTTQNNKNGQNANKTVVTFSNKENQEVKKSMNVKLSVMINRFIEWVRTQLSKFSENFNKNHKKEIEWIKANMKLNEEIGNAIGKSFMPNVANLPKFNIPAEKLIKSANLASLVEEWVDIEKTKDFNYQTALIKASGLGDEEIKQLTAMKDVTEQSNAFANYVLFGNLKQPTYINGPLKQNDWTDLYKDLLATPDLIAKITKAHSEDVNKACEFLRNKTQSLEQSTGDAATKNAAAIERCTQVNKLIQDSVKMYKSKIFNTLNSKFYAKNYVVYREIVAGYKQQLNTANTSTEGANPAENLETPDVNGNTQSSENK